ncbi:hypothetical protein [Cuspidothrix issatschenkoi]|uniref:hypothetical protein n=1 Tax=Cuspidothrix issatschenkoi TaxID=230752 RepID=UPI001D147C3A|nr:hypothetical protein [Cuspidothrix issatschenkoi]
MKLKHYLALTFSVSLSVLHCEILPAYALPGQSIKTVIQWSRNHAKIPPLTSVKKLEEGYPDYSSQTSFKKYSVSFDVWINSKGIVTEEMIDARNYENNRVNLEFTKNNNNALQLINMIYGQTIVNDYQNAKYVDMVKIGGLGLIKFYRGKKYAYQIWGDGGSHQFTIIPLKDLVSRIDNWKRQQ